MDKHHLLTGKNRLWLLVVGHQELKRIWFSGGFREMALTSFTSWSRTPGSFWRCRTTSGQSKLHLWEKLCYTVLEFLTTFWTDKVVISMAKTNELLWLLFLLWHLSTLSLLRLKLRGEEKRKSPAQGGIRTQDLSVTRHVFFRCATTSGLHCLKLNPYGHLSLKIHNVKFDINVPLVKKYIKS